ncbi:TM0106 family RecB-like putative nuclease [Tomitella cavernea]|uniref:TM0106 family RecB-like putative nuclease n=1 Tax=Tomitella cavernea TaxID=1387982 RepID=UPI0027DE743D|nr:TM0106 family RecB-like putative nuclease [Tomitella cavernea]
MTSPAVPANAPAAPALRASDLTRCRHRIHRAATLPRGVVLPAEPTSVAQRKDAAADHREDVRARLADDYRRHHPRGSWNEDVHGEALAAADLAALPDRVWNARLPQERDTLRAGGVDLLLRDDVHGGYIPVIVVNHKVTDPGSGATTSPMGEWAPHADPHRKMRGQTRDQVRLAHVTRMLEGLGLATPVQVGGAIGYDADCIVAYELGGDGGILEQYDARFADRQAVARGLVDTAPARIAECASCPFWNDLTGSDGRTVDGCGTVLRERHDVSLVATGHRGTMLRAAGIGTIDRLAAWQGRGPDEWHGGGFDDTVVSARAWLVDEPLVRRGAHVTVPRADVEVDVDMESYQEHGAYLWGTLLTDAGVDLGYRPFATWDPVPTDDEARSFAEFWTWLMRLRDGALAEGRTFAAYCYSQNAENKWLLGSATRFQGYPAVPPVEEVRAFIESDHWVDIFEYVGENFVSPRGRGLKVLARFAGFDWRDDDAGGEASMAWYRAAVGLDGDAPAHDQRTRVLEYNEDDVRATKALREWMSEAAADEVPSIDDLPVPGEAELRAVEAALG